HLRHRSGAVIGSLRAMTIGAVGDIDQPSLCLSRGPRFRRAAPTDNQQRKQSAHAILHPAIVCHLFLTLHPPTALFSVTGSVSCDTSKMQSSPFCSVRVPGRKISGLYWKFSGP